MEKAFEKLLNDHFDRQKAWQENVALQISSLHSTPSQGTLDRFKNMESRFDSVDKKLDSIVLSLDERVRENANKIRVLEDWKLAFTSKLSVYVGLGVTIGSILGTVLTHFLTDLI